jgi:hypothetical protein
MTLLSMVAIRGGEDWRFEDIFKQPGIEMQGLCGSPLFIMSRNDYVK